MKKIKSALISVFYKDGLEPVIREFAKQGVQIYSTGGTQNFIESLGVSVIPVESLTGYPSILDGRVKTLHPKVFGGILARREDDHLNQLAQYEIPEIDCVIVDLYPFEETLKETRNESSLIEKIDIGGISLIRAAAKNYNDVLCVASREDYEFLLEVITANEGCSTIDVRREFARRSFKISSHYDTQIFNFFSEGYDDPSFKKSVHNAVGLRYGENPHQKGVFYGDIDEMFEKISGKELSYNNLVDIDAAMGLMAELKDEGPSFAILKHTNACGVATRNTVLDAWKDALAGDPVSAFGGILICNREIDFDTAEEIDKIFYEVLLAPSFTAEAQQFLEKKKKRILMRIKHFNIQKRSFKSLLNGVIEQDTDLSVETADKFEIKTKIAPAVNQIDDLVFANKLVKHLKSNTIVLVKNKQLLGMGCGQTSRVDACRQAIEKARHFGMDLEGSVMASDAFFPFPDCVELGYEAGVKSVIQPGGSIKDQLSIDYCDDNGMSMVFTGIRHFKH